MGGSGLLLWLRMGTGCRRWLCGFVRFAFCLRYWIRRERDRGIRRVEDGRL